MNKVYFIGAGPGDPLLLTLMGAQALEASRLVFAPTPYEETFASHLENKRVLIPFDYGFAELLCLIEEALGQGAVAFLVPGDLTFYAPFQGLIDTLGDRACVIPGVGTANAVSARLKKTLDLPGVCSRAIVTSPKTLANRPDEPGLRELAGPGASLLIYMNNLPLPDLVSELRAGYGCSVPIVLAHRVGLPGEELVQGTLDDIVEKTAGRDFFNLDHPTDKPALTLVLVGETLAAVEDGTWWDYRREHFWKPRGQRREP